jgi:predicted ABC-type ATPase
LLLHGKFATAKRHLETAQSFAVETTLSGRGYLQMMLDAKKRNFDIVLIYIGTEKVEINLQRIRNRVLAGGHDVPENDVRRRYGRSFANLPLPSNMRIIAFCSIIRLRKAIGWLHLSADRNGDGLAQNLAGLRS